MLDTSPGPDKLVPIEEVAERFTVSVPTIRAWLRQGHIPEDCYLHVGNTYRFHVNRLVERLLTNPKTDEPAVPAPAPEQLELPLEVTIDTSAPATLDTDKDF